MNIWKTLRKGGDEPYRPRQLVDYRQNAEYREAGIQIICDIDKTYLETEFESITRMVRIAFEDAKAKVTVSGASDFLELARWYSFFDDVETDEMLPRPLHFVSSSPPQLRSVLEEKLLMDGIDWTSATFKNQAYNLKMGRVDLLRQHVAYKTLAILSVVGRAAPGTKFVMVGDNAETDAYIYLGVKFFTEGRLSPVGLQRYLEIAGVEALVAADISAEAQKIEAGTGVTAILIRSVPGYEVMHAPPLTDFISVFTDYFDASLHLLQAGLLDAGSLWQLVRRFHNQHGYSLTSLSRRLRVLRRDPAVGEALRDQIAKVLAKTGLEADRPEDPPAAVRTEGAVVQDLRGDDEILRHARLWMQVIRRHKSS